MVRDFTFSEAEIQKQREELSTANSTEKELWVGFSEFIFIGRFSEKLISR